jgi:hypothetical protein
LSSPDKLNSQSPRRPPAKTPEARENQLISLSYDLVERRLREGTASSQETTHFLKRGSMKDKIEQEILEKQKELIVAKTESIQSAKRIEVLYGEAMKAFSIYSGNSRRSEEDD